jgi:hypothetical protein
MAPLFAILLRPTYPPWLVSPGAASNQLPVRNVLREAHHHSRSRGRRCHGRPPLHLEEQLPVRRQYVDVGILVLSIIRTDDFLNVRLSDTWSGTPYAGSQPPTIRAYSSWSTTIPDGWDGRLCDNRNCWGGGSMTEYNLVAGGCTSPQHFFVPMFPRSLSFSFPS